MACRRGGVGEFATLSALLRSGPGSITEVKIVSTVRPELVAESRQTTGKRVALLRRQGKLPGVVFGHGFASRSVSVDAHAFELLRRRTQSTTLIDVKVDGESALPALIHGVQIHPVTRRPLHVDLFQVRMTEDINIDVPIVLRGEPEAVDKLGGTLFHALDVIKVRALPDRLPESFEVSVDSLVDFDAMIHVRDLTIPEGVTLLTDPDELVARVLPPRIEVEEVAPVEEVEEEIAAATAATAEAAEAPAGAEPTTTE
jgi:large subunit ribosomal protein L25